MNKLVWKLLRQHLSAGQLTGFFLAHLLGMAIILLGIQTYCDIRPIFVHGDSFLKKDYLIATKEVSTLGNLLGSNSTFTPEEIADLQNQDFTAKVGRFTPALFDVSASMGLPNAGIHLSTEMFFEAVPDEFIDADLAQWQADPAEGILPIIIPRNYLNLYNFGFAQSRGLPQLSEGLTGLLQLNITLSGNGKRETYRGRIAGFSNRLNTLLIPQTFMDEANRRLAPEDKPAPSRLIVEVKNPSDSRIAQYFAQKHYQTEGNGLDDGKTSYFLRLLTGIVLAVGAIICLLAFYLLVLSIFLLLQKNAAKLENLLLLGYSPAQVARPYQWLAIGLNAAGLLAALGCVMWTRANYLEGLRLLFPQMETANLWPSLTTGIALAALLAALNVRFIQKKVKRIWMGKAMRASSV